MVPILGRVLLCPKLTVCPDLFTLLFVFVWLVRTLRTPPPFFVQFYLEKQYLPSLKLFLCVTKAECELEVHKKNTTSVSVLVILRNIWNLQIILQILRVGYTALIIWYLFIYFCGIVFCNLEIFNKKERKWWPQKSMFSCNKSIPFCKY